MLISQKSGHLYIILLISMYCKVIFSYIDESHSRLLAELEIADLELSDDCEDLSNGVKSALFQQNFQQKIITEEAHGHLLRVQSNNLKSFDNIPSEVEKNWTHLIKPGDGLLSEEDWKLLVSYHNSNEELVSVLKIPCLNNTDGCIFTRDEYQTILKTTKDKDVLSGTWIAWQHVFLSNNEQYSSILSLVKKAAALNDQSDGQSYWEFLTDVNEGYSKSREFWNEIKPLYTNLHKFVKTRLFKYYDVNNSLTEIPVYLLGSNFGNDWSYIADKILPHPQLHYDTGNFLKYKDITEIYSMAENLTDTVSLGKLGERFWSTSRFNISICEPQILSFCAQEYTELYNCNKSTWVTYLDAHESAFKVALRNQDYSSLMRRNLRYSPIDEAITNLGSLLAIENLAQYDIVAQDINSTSRNDSIYMTKLLLAALRVLPKLAYYSAADEWRLKELEELSENPSVTWWEYRKQYQGVTGVTNAENDFLRDKYLTFNKPYLSKFLGIILAFQFMDYYKSQLSSPTDNLAVEIGKDPNFLSMVKDRPIFDWSYLLRINYGFELSVSPFLKYFEPLEKYLQTAPLEQAPIITTTTTTSTTTITPTSMINNNSKHETVTVKDKLLEKNLSKIDTVLNDEPKMNSTLDTSTNKNQMTGNFTMYAGVGLLVLVACLLVIAYGYKHIRRRRRRTNNRRFET